MVKIYTRFQTKTAQKTIPFGAAHTYVAYVGEYPPGSGGRWGLLEGEGGGAYYKTDFQTCLLEKGALRINTFAANF